MRIGQLACDVDWDEDAQLEAMVVPPQQTLIAGAAEQEADLDAQPESAQQLGATQPENTQQLGATQPDNAQQLGATQPENAQQLGDSQGGSEPAISMVG